MGLYKIRITDAEAMAEAARTQEGQELSAYDIAARFNAVRVGESPTFYFYHTNLPDAHVQAAVPVAEKMGDDYDDLSGTYSPFILEATYEATEDIDGQETTVTRRVKERDVPDGITPIETGLVPHRFA